MSNDEPPGPLRARGTIKGTGEETKEIDNVITKKHEVVHTFGWYMRKMIADVQAKGCFQCWRIESTWLKSARTPSSMAWARE